MSEHTPIIVVELLLVVGGVIAFAWWQLRDVTREQAKTAERRAREAAEAAAPERED
jgi:predicted negative regulator of RcsB-dependent stress response